MVNIFSLPQEIYKDRKKFNKQVFEVASSDLVNMGITVVSYTIKDIHDEEVGIMRLLIFHMVVIICRKIKCLHFNIIVESDLIIF